jgi:hypothetical protein
LPLLLAIANAATSNAGRRNGLAAATFAEGPGGPCRDIGIYRSLEPGFPPMPVAEYMFDNTREGKNR